MSQITLACLETPNLKLGPGLGTVSTPGDLIVFTNGYATFESDDYPDWVEWQLHPGSPFIEVLDAGEIAATDPDAIVCPTCGKAFATKKALNGHRLSHAKGK